MIVGVVSVDAALAGPPVDACSGRGRECTATEPSGDAIDARLGRAALGGEEATVAVPASAALVAAFPADISLLGSNDGFGFLRAAGLGFFGDFPG